MMLLTQAIRKTMPGYRAQENVNDPIAYVKFFHPQGSWTWYATEAWQIVYNSSGDFIGEKSLSYALKEGETVEDIHFFGKVISDMCPEGELGNFSFNELKNIGNKSILPIERDLYWDPKLLSLCKGPGM